MHQVTRRLVAMVVLGLGLYGGLVSSAFPLDGPLTLEPQAGGVSVAATPTPQPLPVVRLEDDDLRMTLAGAWRTSSWTPKASGQTWVYSSTRGARVRTYFDGTSVAWLGGRGPDRGRARVYVDGTAVATVDLYAPTPQHSRVVWQSVPLSDARHSLTVEVLGTKRSASSGKRVVVDALDVTGTVVAENRSGTLVNNGNRKLARTGRWWTSTRDNAFRGSAWRTAMRNSTAIVRFKGTGVAWIGRKDAVSGRAEVLLDGRRVAIVSQYQKVVAERRVAWSTSGLPYGKHTLVVRALGSPTAGTGTRVDVDAFLVRGTLLQAYRPTPFKYPWSSYIVIDKSRFRLYWVKNGLLIDSYPVAHGRASTPTPSRVWRIDSKYRPDPDGIYGPRKMRLYRRVSTSYGYRYEYTRYAIHGTNEPWVIGTLASHGCIRMYNRDVLELWPQVPLGTMVITRD